MNHSNIGKMLNLKIKKCYEIQSGFFSKKKKFYIAGKTHHSQKAHSYLAISPGDDHMSNDYGIYIWDKGYCYWSMETGQTPSLSDSCITYCRELNKKETEIFMKSMKNHEQK